MTDVTGIAIGSIEKPSIEDNAASYPCRYDHREVVLDTLCRT
jgi:hypothetical protein